MPGGRWLEITAIPKLLELLDLNNAVMTIDASPRDSEGGPRNRCQEEIAAKIRECGGDYVLALKGNQPTMHERAAALFIEASSADESESGRGRARSAPEGLKRWVTKERRRGADELREYTVMPVPKNFPNAEAWGIQSLGMVIRRRIESDGSETGQVRYYVSTLRPLVRPFAYAVRSHWGIENRLHWTLDVTFSEDQCRIRKGSGPETTATLGRVAVSKLRQDTSVDVSLRCKRKVAGWSTDRLEAFLFGIPE